jgi:diacylglycerol kinase
MAHPPRFSLRKRAQSFVFAFKGLLYFLVTQHNARIHLSIATCVASLAAATMGLLVFLPKFLALFSNQDFFLFSNVSQVGM